MADSKWSGLKPGEKRLLSKCFLLGDTAKAFRGALISALSELHLSPLTEPSIHMIQKMVRDVDHFKNKADGQICSAFPLEKDKHRDAGHVFYGPPIDDIRKDRLIKMAVGRRLEDLTKSS